MMCLLSSYRGTGFWVLIFLFPVVTHPLQEGAPLSGCAPLVGGVFMNTDSDCDSAVRFYVFRSEDCLDSVYVLM